MSKRRNWISSIDLRKNALWLMEEDTAASTRMYLEHRRNTINPFDRNATWTIWQNDDQVFCGSSMGNAYRKYAGITHRHFFEEVL